MNISENIKQQIALKCLAILKKYYISQEKLASIIGISQPRLNDLLKLKLNKFSIESLIIIANELNLNVDIRIKRRHRAKNNEHNNMATL